MEESAGPKIAVGPGGQGGAREAGDFEEALRARNAASLRLFALLCVLFVPAFWILDWIVLPRYVGATFALRALDTLCAATILAACRVCPQRVEQHAHPLALSLLALVGGSLAATCWLSGGYESPYYAGISLVVLAAGLVFVWPLRTALWVFGLLYGFYMAPLVLGLIRIRHPDAALSNQFFLLGTIAVTLFAQHQRMLRERREFGHLLEEQRVGQELARLASSDELTGLWNRRHFLGLARAEFARAVRHERPLTLAVLDLDHFKQVNDRYGHAVGDEVLRAVADLLRAQVRQHDVVGRFGGEEFTLLLPETDWGTAYGGVAERIREAMGSRPINTSAGRVPVTLSIGLASRAPQDENLEALLQRADRALYQAKRRGRNRVEFRS